MATVFNKRKHSLEAGGVTLQPGENTVDDKLWSQVNVPGSQFETWSKLNWVAAKPVSGAGKPAATKDATAAGTTFHAPTVDGPVSQEPGSDMNPSTAPTTAAEEKPEPEKHEDEHKRSLRTRR